LVELSWRWIFFVNVPVGLLALAVGPWVLTKTTPVGAGVPDVFGAVCLVAGVGALVWALIQLSETGWSAAKVIIAVVGAAGALAVAVWRSRRHPSPAIDLAAIRVVPVWSSCVAMVLFAAAFGAMLLGNVIFLTTVWGDTPAVARSTDRQGRRRRGCRGWNHPVRGRHRHLAVPDGTGARLPY
jgi:MFS family permease